MKDVKNYNFKNKVRSKSYCLGCAVLLSTLVGEGALAQVSTLGLPPASNTQSSYVDASIARDSEINQPLDLLNDFYPAVEVTITDHDNVRRRSDFQEDDLKIAVKPSLAYRTNIGRHKFYAAYNGVFTFHDELDQEDQEAHALNAQLSLDLAHRWDLNLFAGIGESYEERGISGSRGFNQLINGIDSSPDDISYLRYGADLVYGRKFSPLVAVLGIEKQSSDYDNNFQGSENPVQNRNREVDSLHFDLSYRIADRTSIFGRINYSEIDYDRSANSLDSEQTSYLLGLRWKPSNTLSGTVGIGETEKDFNDPSRPDYDGTSYYANLNYSINPFSNLSFNASRFVEEPGDDLSDFYESDLFGVSWDHAITPRVLFNAFVKWIDDDYNTGRKDEFVDFGLGVDYVWRSWLSAGLYYGEIERDSSITSIDYDDSYFGIRLRSDLRSLLKGRGSRDRELFERRVEEYKYPQQASQR